MKSFLGTPAVTRERSLRREIKIYFRRVFCQRKKLLHYLKTVFLVFFRVYAYKINDNLAIENKLGAYVQNYNKQIR